MTDEELLEKLIHWYRQASKMLSLGNLELLKSDELYSTKYKIEDALASYRPYVSEDKKNQIDKLISKNRITPQPGLFLESKKVNLELQDLYILLKELIKEKGGSGFNLDSITRASGF